MMSVASNSRIPRGLVRLQVSTATVPHCLFLCVRRMNRPCYYLMVRKGARDWLGIKTTSSVNVVIQVIKKQLSLLVLFEFELKNIAVSITGMLVFSC